MVEVSVRPTRAMLGLNLDLPDTTSMPMPLCPAELLALSGADASSFAQAQFTSDVSALAPGQWQWSAWLDAQGRARHFFLLMRVEPDRLLTWLPLGGADVMRDALARYVFRARLTLSASTDWALHALSADELDAPLDTREVVVRAAGLAFRQPGGENRIAWLRPTPAAGIDTDALSRWRAADIAAGLPLLAPALAGEFVPQALGLERLDAIRFDKGCYPGQEIAARLHFRGGNKRSLRRLLIEGAPLTIGEDLLAEDGTNVGRVLYSSSTPSGRSEALAVLPAERTNDQPTRSSSGSRAELMDV